MKKHQLIAKLKYQRDGFTAPNLLSEEEIDYLLKLIESDQMKGTKKDKKDIIEDLLTTFVNNFGSTSEDKKVINYLNYSHYWEVDGC